MFLSSYLVDRFVGIFAEVKLVIHDRRLRGVDDVYLLGRIDLIRHAIHSEEMWVKAAMGGTLIGTGNRNKKLNKAAVRAAQAIGLIDVDYGDDNSREPLNVLQHLTSYYLKQKLGV